MFVTLWIESDVAAASPYLCVELDLEGSSIWHNKKANISVSFSEFSPVGLLEVANKILLLHHFLNQQSVRSWWN
jgi:hypothetical protein